MKILKKLLVPHMYIFLLLGISCILIYTTLTNGHNWGGDFSSYIMQAQSITEGTPQSFIEKNRFTIERSSRSLGPVAYPWGFSVLLAPLYLVFGLDMIALKSLGAMSFLFFLLLLWFGFQKEHSYFWRLFLVALFGLNPYLLSYLNNILSDIPFLLFSTLSLLLMGKVIVENRCLTTSRIFDYILLGLSITTQLLCLLSVEQRNL